MFMGNVSKWEAWFLSMEMFRQRIDILLSK